MMCAGMVHLPFGWMAMDWQASDMSSMAGTVPSGCWCVWWIAWFSPNLAIFTSRAAAHHTAHLQPRTQWCLLAYSICLLGVWQWIDKPQTWAPWLGLFLLGVDVRAGLPADFGPIWPFSPNTQPHITLHTSNHRVEGQRKETLCNANDKLKISDSGNFLDLLADEPITSGKNFAILDHSSLVFEYLFTCFCVNNVTPNYMNCFDIYI